MRSQWFFGADWKGTRSGGRGIWAVGRGGGVAGVDLSRDVGWIWMFSVQSGALPSSLPQTGRSERQGLAANWKPALHVSDQLPIFQYALDKITTNTQHIGKDLLNRFGCDLEDDIASCRPYNREKMRSSRRRLSLQSSSASASCGRRSSQTIARASMRERYIFLKDIAGLVETD